MELAKAATVFSVRSLDGCLNTWKNVLVSCENFVGHAKGECDCTPPCERCGESFERKSFQSSVRHIIGHAIDDIDGGPPVMKWTPQENWISYKRKRK